MSNPIDFSGKIALVTGSSRNIGAGIATALAKHGAKVVLNYVNDSQGRNRTDADALAKEINSPLTLEFDVSDHAAVGKAFATITEQLGGLDFLVNNAGILRDRTLKKMTPQDFHDVINVNLTGAFNTLQHATSALRPSGRVVNITSVSGLLGFFGQANYSSSKAGLIALTKVAAREFARQKITVNAVAPGFISTEMSAGMPEEVTKRFIEQIPLGAFGRIEDVVNAVLFLCSPLASYMTGQVLHVNGGFFME
jgi:3-oxoacyl-[acyl-carrier protein] reductase